MLEELRAKLPECEELINADKFDDLFRFEVHDAYEPNEKKPLEFVFAQYVDTPPAYAIYYSGALTKKLFEAIGIFLSNVEDDAKIIVFSQECYDELCRHRYDKNLDIHLCI